MPENNNETAGASAATPPAAPSASPAVAPPSVNAGEQNPLSPDAIQQKVTEKLAKQGITLKPELSDRASQDGGRSGSSNSIIIDTRGSSRRRSGSGGGGGSSDSGETVAIVFVVFLFLYLIVRAITGCRTRGRYRRGESVIGGGFTPEEVALMHKMQRTLGQMESRVEALETILIDARRSGASSIAASRRSARAQNPDPAATHDL